MWNYFILAKKCWRFSNNYPLPIRISQKLFRTSSKTKHNFQKIQLFKKSYSKKLSKHMNSKMRIFPFFLESFKFKLNRFFRWFETFFDFFYNIGWKISNLSHETPKISLEWTLLTIYNHLPGTVDDFFNFFFSNHFSKNGLSWSPGSRCELKIGGWDSFDHLQPFSRYCRWFYQHFRFEPLFKILFELPLRSLKWAQTLYA